MDRPPADIVLGVGTTCLFLGFWLVGGPGPKYEEHTGAMGMAAVVGAVGGIASIARPRPILNPLLHSGLWFLAFLASWGQIAYKYDYACLNMVVLGFGFSCVASLWGGLLLVNLLALAVRKVLRAMSRDFGGRPGERRGENS